MRNSRTLILGTFWALWSCGLQANPKWFGLPYDPFAGLDDCAKALVQRLVLDQKFPLFHRNFHQMESSFNRLGIQFDAVEHEDIPLDIGENLVSYEALSIHRAYRGDIVTEYLTVETRIGAPQVLAERVNAKAFWHADEDGFFGVLTGTKLERGQTRGSAELQRLWLEAAGSGPALREEIPKLNSEGKARQQALAEEAIEFYMRNLVRRKWSDKTKSRLRREFFESLRQSVLSISRLRSTGEVVGIFQNIRAPYGRRILARPRGKDLEILSDEFGAWGESVRRFGIKTAEVMYLTDSELYDRMNENREPDGSLRMIRPPVEIKAREQNIAIVRNCMPTESETICVNGEVLTVFWGSGEVDEPARLAVDRSQNPHLFVEIFTQLMATAVDPHFSMDYNLHNRLHVTYNDRPALYYDASFRETGRNLIIDGEPWPILSATGEEHIASLKKLTRPLAESDAVRLDQIKRSVLSYMDGAQ